MTLFDQTSTFVRNPDLIATDMDGDTVMMSIEHGTYYGIGGVGSRVWELLAQPVSFPEITSTICTEFKVDKSTCQADMERFLGELHTLGLIDAHQP